MSGGEADPDPLDAFGTRGTRGIRGGRAAKRKREAFLRWNEEQGRDRSTVPVIHAGGLARPLGTSKFWVPSDSEAEDPSEVAVDSSPVAEGVVELEVPVLRTLSSATPEVTRLVPKAALFSVVPSRNNPLLKSSSGLSSSGASSSSVGASAKASAKPKPSPPPGPPPSRPKPSSAPVDSLPSRPKPSSAPVDSLPSSSSSSSRPQGPRVPEVPEVEGVGTRLARFHSSIEVYRPQVIDSEYRLTRVQEPDRLCKVTGRLIAVDFHQVLDIDRSVTPWERVSDQGVLPHRNRAFVQYFQQLLHKQVGSPSGTGLNQFSVIVLSHVNTDWRLRSCVQAIEASKLRVCAVIFTRSPIGVAGKASVIRELSHPSVPSNRCVIIDDRLETCRECIELGFRAVHIQVKRKERPTEEELRFKLWSFRSLRETADLVEELASGEWDDY